MWAPSAPAYPTAACGGLTFVFLYLGRNNSENKLTFFPYSLSPTTWYFRCLGAWKQKRCWGGGGGGWKSFPVEKERIKWDSGRWWLCDSRSHWGSVHHGQLSGLSSKPVTPADWGFSATPALGMTKTQRIREFWEKMLRQMPIWRTREFLNGALRESSTQQTRFICLVGLADALIQNDLYFHAFAHSYRLIFTIWARLSTLFKAKMEVLFWVFETNTYSTAAPWTCERDTTSYTIREIQAKRPFAI